MTERDNSGNGGESKQKPVDSSFHGIFALIVVVVFCTWRGEDRSTKDLYIYFHLERILVLLFMRCGFKINKPIESDLKVGNMLMVDFYFK